MVNETMSNRLVSPLMSESHAGSRAFITDIDGLFPTADEAAFLRDTRPFGLILFARNIAEPAQVADLCAQFRDLVGREHAPVLVDQEGGRVQRLKPPVWRQHPPARAVGDLYEADPERGLRAAWLHGRSIAAELAAVGIDVDCLPCLDIPVAGAHDVIGMRAFSSDLASVVALAGAQVDGLVAGGVSPVIKHMPGHGRADADTHHGLPRVDASLADLAEQDHAAFAPFADAPYAMTAHVVQEAVDPDHPATQSAKVIETIVREVIGFAGLLMTDDLSMEALSGPHADRARASLDAGCDVVLHCNASFEDRRAVAEVAPLLDGSSLQRANRAVRPAVMPFDADAGFEELEALLSRVAVA